MGKPGAELPSKSDSYIPYLVIFSIIPISVCILSIPSDSPVGTFTNELLNHRFLQNDELDIENSTEKRIFEKHMSINDNISSPQVIFKARELKYLRTLFTQDSCAFSKGPLLHIDEFTMECRNGTKHIKKSLGSSYASLKIERPGTPF